MPMQVKTRSLTWWPGVDMSPTWPEIASASASGLEVAAALLRVRFSPEIASASASGLEVAAAASSCTIQPFSSLAGVLPLHKFNKSRSRSWAASFLSLCSLCSAV